MEPQILFNNKRIYSIQVPSDHLDTGRGTNKDESKEVRFPVNFILDASRAKVRKLDEEKLKMDEIVQAIKLPENSFGIHWTEHFPSDFAIGQNTEGEASVSVIFGFEEDWKRCNYRIQPNRSISFDKNHKALFTWSLDKIIESKDRKVALWMALKKLFDIQ